MTELEVLISLVNKLAALGYINSAEKYGAEQAIEKLKGKLKEEDGS